VTREPVRHAIADDLGECASAGDGFGGPEDPRVPAWPSEAYIHDTVIRPFEEKLAKHAAFADQHPEVS
jgi:hypothetical protein